MPLLTMLNENKSFGVWCPAHPLKWDWIYCPSGSCTRAPAENGIFSLAVKIENWAGGQTEVVKGMEIQGIVVPGMGWGWVWTRKE